MICTCSHHFTREDMDTCVRKVATSTSRSIGEVEERGPGRDHPVREGHVQGEYLRVNIYEFDS